MQNKKMRFILLEPFRRHRVVELVDNIETFHKVLDCRCVDIVQRSWGGITCDVVLDDEGLLRSKIPVSYWLDIEETDDSVKARLVERLVGSVLLCAADDNGELIEHPRLDELDAYFDFCDGFRKGFDWMPYNHDRPFPHFD